MNVNEKMVMVVDNKKYCLIGRLEWTVKNEKAKLLCLMFQWKRVLLFIMFFHVLYRRGRLVLSVVIASPLVLNFCTIGMVSWLFLIGWPPPLLERIKRCQNLTAADIDTPSPSHHTHLTSYTGTYIIYIHIDTGGIHR